jgi:multisubunit Na+/H+ antiporter MnhC subunit
MVIDAPAEEKQPDQNILKHNSSPRAQIRCMLTTIICSFALTCFFYVCIFSANWFVLQTNYSKLGCDIIAEVISVLCLFG